VPPATSHSTAVALPTRWSVITPRFERPPLRS
jgi:hypothetical protein